jgi:hypothetical protein
MPQPEPFEALVAFVAEHQGCGELDGERDGGYVWLACSCGAQIIQPVSEPPKAPAATLTRPPDPPQSQPSDSVLG